MHRAILWLICLFCLTPTVRAQWPKDKNACYYERKENAPYKKKLWHGYEVSLGPVPNPEGVEYRCTVAIYNSTGRVVFRTSGFNVVFDEEQTGKDFDGDGKPEVVFRTDTGGGNYCCWSYIIYSLSPKPHKLFEINVEGRVVFETDENRNMVIWKRTAGLAGYTSMAAQPFAEKILRVREGKLVDATSEFCPRIFSNEDEDYRIATALLTPEKLEQFQRGAIPEGDKEEIVSVLLSRALQHVFCRQFEEALSELNLWPDASRSDMKANFASSVQEEYPEFAAKLRESAVKK